jgi:hypothetical protein
MTVPVKTAIQGDIIENAPSEGSAFLAMIERAARDPSIDIDKLDRLLMMRERENARVAEREFSAAMSSAQAAMLPINTDSKNDQTRSKYASYAALDSAVRPIYTKHGFGLTFNTEDAPHDLEVRVVCQVHHTGGHTGRYHIDMPVDGKGARGGDVMTRTHAMGSGVSYGMRYLLKMIFNLAIGKDDDGNAAGYRQETARRPAPPAPNRMRSTEPSAAAAEAPAPSHEPPNPSLVDGSAIESGAGTLSLDQWMLGLTKAAERGEVEFRAAWADIPPKAKRALSAFKDSLKARMGSS